MADPSPTMPANEMTSSRPRFRDYPQPKYWLPWLVLGMFRLFGLLPQWVVWYGGMVLGELTYYLHRTSTIRVNIALCFPALSQKQQKRLRRRYYHYVGRTFLGLGTAWYASEEKMRRLVKVKGREHLLAAQASKKSILFLAPHFLPLEMGGIYISFAEGNFVGFYRKPRNPLFHHAIRYFMSRFGGSVIERYDNLRPLLRAMQKSKIIYYLPDQDPDRSDDSFVFADFFGVPAATYTAFARLAKTGNAKAVPVFTRMLPRGAGYEVEYLPALANFPSGDDLADAERINKVIETAIKESPEQYLWSYRRFKTRPNGAPPPYGR